MRRRDFIAGLGGTVAYPLAARAQQPATPVIGFLSGGSPHDDEKRLGALRQGLGETGFAEGRNIVIEHRWADGRNERLGGLAADLVRGQARVIITVGVAATQAAKAATATIPVVFGVGGDPVQLGLVASLNRPGGSLTGVTTLNTDLGPKRLELLHELIPAATTIAVLVNPIGPIAEGQVKEMRAAARTLGLQLHVLHAGTEHDFETAFSTLVQLRAGGLVIGVDPLLTSRNEQLAALTVRDAVPAIDPYREFVAAGGLMSYGGSVADQYRVSGLYAGRILKGERPADLPVQRSTKVELIMNLKTAKALGLTIPEALLATADEVIQ
jgi:putative ABC transport system substrate-binding protein